MTGTIDPLLLTVEQVATQLNVSSKTVSRLISNNEFQFLRIGRSIRIPREELCNYVERNKRYNSGCVGSVVQEKSTCHLNAMPVNIGGPRMPTQVENELDVLLARPIEEKPLP